MAKKIFIGENKIRDLSRLLTENWAETKRAIVRKTLAVLSSIFPEASVNELNSLESIILKKFFHGRLASDPKYRPLEPLFAKILYGELDFDKNFQTDDYGLLVFRKLLRNIKTLAKNKIKPQFSMDDTLESLVDRFGTKTEDLAKFGIDVTNDGHEKAPGSDYTYVEICDFDTAAEYGEMSNPGGKLCYTQDEETWDEYTDNGNNWCYLFLRDGYEDEQPVDGEDSPYDDYGLSMIWVFISPNGEITTSNTRWNHHNENRLPPGRETDYSFDEDEIEEITGYNIHELDCDGDETNTPEILEREHEFSVRMKKGLGLEESSKGIVDDIEKFGDIYLVSIEAAWTFVKDDRILYPNLWCYVFNTSDESQNILRILCKKKNNIIFSDGSLLVDDNEWFDYIQVLSDYKFFITKKEDKFNLYDFDGNKAFNDDVEKIKTLYGKNFYKILPFLSVKVSDNEWYIYSLERHQFTSNEPSSCEMERIDGSNWFSFRDKNYLYDFIDINGNRLYGEGKFRSIDHRFINGLIRVDVDNKTNYMDIDGNLMFDESDKVSYTETVFGDFGIVTEVNGDMCIIDRNKEVYRLSEYINDMFLAKDSPYHLDNVNDVLKFKKINDRNFVALFHRDYKDLKCLGEYTFGGRTLLNNTWLETIEPITDTLFLVTQRYKYNLMTSDGKLMFDETADEIKKWNNNYLIAKFKRKREDSFLSSRYEEYYALVDIRTNRITYRDVKKNPGYFNEDNPKPIPIEFKGFMNYITPEGTLLNNIKYGHVDSFYEGDWARVYVDGGYNVVFLDGSMLSEEKYKKIIDGRKGLFVVVKPKEDKDVYLVSRDGKVNVKYTYELFPYVYKNGLGNLFGSCNRIGGTNLVKVLFRNNVYNDGYGATHTYDGCNVLDLSTDSLLFKELYSHISTVDGRLFVVGLNDGNYSYDVIDINGNSLLGDRKAYSIYTSDIPIGQYEVVFRVGKSYYDDEYEFYDKNFKLLARMTYEELTKYREENGL
jgi:hypothetical protein